MEPVGVRGARLEEEEVVSHVRKKKSDDCSSVGGIKEYDEIVSKTFVSEEAAYDFFNQYAKKKGFSVRRSDVRKDELKRITYRKFCCHRAGYRKDKWKNLENRQRAPREDNRCGCPVELTIKLDSKCDHWWVYNFVDEHNHDCDIDSVFSLRSHRRIDEGQKLEIVALEAAGASKSLILQTLQAKAGGVKEVGFLGKDLYNFLDEQDRMQKLGDDADVVISLFNQRKLCDPEFYFDHEVDKERRLTRFFWADSQSKIDYNVFGDVVIFDSTYKLNRYNMAVVPFLGVNHHGSSTIFGCGFVSRETDDSYRWLLSAFLKAMCQVKPNSVITDGDRAMCKAIRELWPSATHRICSWHMERNAKKYISDLHVLNKFHSLLSDTCSPETFERKWSAFEEVCSEREKTREWLKHLYNTKELWGGAFVGNAMFLGMSTNQRSESLNSRLHMHMNSQISLRKAVQHVDRVISKMRMDEAFLDGKSFRAQPNCTSLFRNLERHAGSIFTPYAFRIIQKELEKVGCFVITETIETLDSIEYILGGQDGMGIRETVIWSGSGENHGDIKCSCFKLEREKIPCCHVLVVLIHLEEDLILEGCIWDRWRKNCKALFPSDREGGLFPCSEQVVRYNQLSKMGNLVFHNATKSHENFVEKRDTLAEVLRMQNCKFKYDCRDEKDCRTCTQDEKSQEKVGNPKCVVGKGAPRKRKDERLKSAFESCRKNKCGQCGKRGHNRQTCPDLRVCDELLPPTAQKDEVTKALTGVFQNAVNRGVRNISFGDLSSGEEPGMLIKGLGGDVSFLTLEYIKALGLAVSTYRDHKSSWEGLMKRGMSKDFTWDTAASHYEQIFERASIDKPYVQ